MLHLNCVCVCVDMVFNGVRDVSMHAYEWKVATGSTHARNDSFFLKHKMCACAHAHIPISCAP